MLLRTPLNSLPMESCATMTVRRLAEKQPDSFAFSEANREWAEWRISLVPARPAGFGGDLAAVAGAGAGRLGDRAGDRGGRGHARHGRRSASSRSRPSTRCSTSSRSGRIAHLQVCGTTPCWLRGANDLKEVCRKRINHEQFHLSAGRQLLVGGGRVHRRLRERAAHPDQCRHLRGSRRRNRSQALIDDLAAGRPVKPGPQIDRQFSAPEGGPTSLMIDRRERGVDRDVRRHRQIPTRRRRSTPPSHRPRPRARPIRRARCRRRRRRPRTASPPRRSVRRRSARPTVDEPSAGPRRKALTSPATPTSRRRWPRRVTASPTTSSGSPASDPRSRECLTTRIFHFDQIAAWGPQRDRVGRREAAVQGPDRPRELGGAGQGACRRGRRKERGVGA